MGWSGANEASSPGAPRRALIGLPPGGGDSRAGLRGGRVKRTVKDLQHDAGEPARHGSPNWGEDRRLSGPGADVYASGGMRSAWAVAVGPTELNAEPAWLCSSRAGTMRPMPDEGGDAPARPNWSATNAASS